LTLSVIEKCDKLQQDLESDQQLITDLVFQAHEECKKLCDEFAKK